MGNFGESLEKKDKALKELENFLVEQGDTRVSSKNSAIADNEIAWELGTFDAKGEKDPEIYRDGFIVRTRRDAIATNLNSVAILEKLEKIEDSISDLRKSIYFIVLILLINYFGVYFWR